jgi:4-hydroxy-4-methyl-2-oxoglutarate aldolase
VNHQLQPIRREIERTAPALVAKAAQFGSSMIADVAGRRGALNGRIQGIDKAMKFAGPAFTVEVRPGDNLMIHAALALAQPGDVVVVDGGAYLGSALTGFLMVSQAKLAQLAGFVIDGAVRDIEETCNDGFPVFAAGSNPNGPTKALVGKVNWSVSVGGVAVNPGDLIVGDADGVVAVPREKAEEVVAAVQAKLDAEQQFLQGLAEGVVRNGWVTDALRTAGALRSGETL